MKTVPESEKGLSTSDEEAENSISARLRLLQGTLSDSAFAQKCKVPLSSMRKYLAGSIPGTDKMVQMAKANDVAIAWLAAGEGVMRPRESPPHLAASERRPDEAIDPGIIRDVVQAVEEFERERYARLPPEKKAELIMLLCQEIADDEAASGGHIDRRTAARYALLGS